MTGRKYETDLRPFRPAVVEMENLSAWACFALTFCLPAFPQAEIPTFKAEVRNAFIWGEDAPSGAMSSAIKDPLTGADIFKLRHSGVEVSSRMGFEKLRREDATELIVYSTTIVNNTDAELTVEPGGITVDGRLVPLLAVDSSLKGAKNKRSRGVAEVVHAGDLHCFSSGTLSGENFFATGPRSAAMGVEPGSSVTVSGVIRDPRFYPLLCTVDGCFPKGTIRYSIHVGGHEYIFAWSGRSVMNCGK